MYNINIIIQNVKIFTCNDILLVLIFIYFLQLKEKAFFYIGTRHIQHTTLNVLCCIESSLPILIFNTTAPLLLRLIYNIIPGTSYLFFVLAENSTMIDDESTFTWESKLVIGIYVVRFLLAWEHVQQMAVVWSNLYKLCNLVGPWLVFTQTGYQSFCCIRIMVRLWLDN